MESCAWANIFILARNSALVEKRAVPCGTALLFLVFPSLVAESSKLTAKQ